VLALEQAAVTEPPLGLAEPEEEPRAADPAARAGLGVKALLGSIVDRVTVFLDASCPPSICGGAPPNQGRMLVRV